jgi:phosphate starvation-inducible PhoH-like protein
MIERIVNEDLESYNDKKKANEAKYLNEYYSYVSPKEKTQVEAKFTKPRSCAQKKYVQVLSDQTQTIVIATGPAGSGKTLLATEMGIKGFLQGKFEKLVFVRPAVTTDEEIGFLPGTLEDKLAPWMRPLYDVLYNFITPHEVTQLIEEKIIEISPLAYMRGRTFKNCWIVADEMQNSSINQMKMMLTRIGENTRLIITGDLEQNDRHGEINGLEDFLSRFQGRRSDSISSIEFDTGDIERSEVVKEILDIYKVIDLPPGYLDLPPGYLDLPPGYLDLPASNIDLPASNIEEKIDIYSI